MRYVDLSGLFCFFRILLAEKSGENKGSPMGSSGGKRRMPLLVCQYKIELRGTVSLSSLTRE